MSPSTLQNMFETAMKSNATDSENSSAGSNLSIPRTTLAPILPDNIHDYYLEIANEKMFQETLLPSMIYLIILLFVGIVGNSMVCYIYHTKRGTDLSNKKMKSSDIFILTLAYLDILNCLLSVPVEIFLLRYFVMFDHPWICKISRYAAMVFNASSSFVLLGIAIDRFIGIKYSQSKYRFNSTTAMKFVIGSIVVAVLISVPGLLLYGTQTLPLSAKPVILGKTCLYEDTYLHTKYPLTLSMFLLTVHLLFDMFFIILYGLLGKKIIKNRHFSSIQTLPRNKNVPSRCSQSSGISYITFNSGTQNNGRLDSLDTNSNVDITGFRRISEYSIGTFSSQSQLPVSDREDRRKCTKHAKKQTVNKDSAVHGRVYNTGKTTIMLFAVTITFMLTFAPYCAIAIIRSVSSDDFYIKLSNIEKSIYQLFLRSYLLSSAANPVIYSFLSDKFRLQCKHLLNKIFKC